jgi:DNA mismatch repair protein MutS
MSVYNDYVEKTIKYKEEYGNKTIVLYQVGSFYEMYSTDDNIVNLTEITDLLNIQKTKRNKSKIDINDNNPYMAGFGICSLDKYKRILLNANYTVVIIDQTENNMERVVTDIISPGTRIDDLIPSQNNILLLITIEENCYKNNIQLLIACCFLDLSTGKSFLDEIQSNDNNYYLDELYKLILIFQPKEAIISSIKNLDYINFQKIISYLSLDNIYVHNRIGKINKEMEKLAYQRDIFKKIFPHYDGLLSIHEFLNLEKKQVASLALTYLLNFCYQRNKYILNKIQFPQLLPINNEYCNIAYNTSKQLDLPSLENILNKCKTAIGKRQFKETLLLPLLCPNKINERYEYVDKFTTFITNKDFINYLDDIYDIERYYRLICIKKFQPNLFSNIIKTLESLKKLNTFYKFNQYEHITQLYNKIIKYINFDIIKDEINIFKKEIYSELDDLENKINNDINIFQKVANKLHSEYIKVESTENEGYYLVITKTRLKNIENSIKNIEIVIDNYIFNWSDFRKIENKSKIKLYCENFNIINLSIKENTEIIKKKINIYYNNFLQEISDEFNDLFIYMSQYISEVDWYYSCAKNSVDYKYVKPTIIENENKNSFISCKVLRHPIVEQILLYEKYIPNDIELGIENNIGILLYGANSSGKSCLSKSVAIAVIMAQVGMFVPASSFKYFPYNEIFSRIPSGDNIHKGHSTFIVELNELRNILNRTSSNSLVIGDELCSSTEYESGSSIIGTAIVGYLIPKKTNFIFASHLHDLPKISLIEKLIKQNIINIFHLNVEFNNDKLIYYRKLTPGQGEKLYGLEVCKSIIKDNQFQELAQSIRNEILKKNEYLCNTKKSRYNSNIYVDICAICKNYANEVHHIEQQSLADNMGFIGSMHKNKTYNLVPLCNDCHIKQHQGKISIKGHKLTTNGFELIYEN